jgi:hypothetical protein
MRMIEYRGVLIPGPTNGAIVVSRVLPGEW